MPSSAARPPRSSSTALSPARTPTGSSDSGTVLAAIRAIVPSVRMKIMSSGMSVFRIQKLRGARRIEGKEHAAIGRQRRAAHQPLRLLLLGAGDLDGEAVAAAAALDSERRSGRGPTALWAAAAASCATLAADSRWQAAQGRKQAQRRQWQSASSRLHLDGERPLAAAGDARPQRLIGHQVGEAAAADRLHMDEDVLRRRPRRGPGSRSRAAG